MPPIRCHYADCINLEEGFCTAGSIELEIEDGCLTYEPVGDIPVDDWDGDEPYDDFWEDDDELLYDDGDIEEWSDDGDLDD